MNDIFSTILSLFPWKDREQEYIPKCQTTKIRNIRVAQLSIDQHLMQKETDNLALSKCSFRTHK